MSDTTTDISVEDQINNGLDLDNPKFRDVTVIDIAIDKEVTTAKVYVRILGEAPEQNDTLRALRNANKKIRFLLAERIKIKSLPKIFFYLDKSFERVVRLEEIFKQLADERDAKHNPEADI